MIKKTLPQKVFSVVNVLIMIALCFIILFPYVNVLAVSLNDGMKAVPSGLMMVPKALTFRNYKTLLSDQAILRAIVITVGRVVSGVLLSLAVTFCASYGLTRKNLPFRKIIVLFLFIPSFISGGLIPQYVLYSNLRLLNNPLVYILPTTFTFMNFILFRTYISTIPESLEESARLDGAGEFTIMLRIFLPLCVPIIATIALFGIVYHWNDWTTTMYYMSNNKWNTLAYELKRVLKEQDRLIAMMRDAYERGDFSVVTTSTSEGLKYAQIILSSIPIIAIYPFLQRYFIRGIMVGGVKE